MLELTLATPDEEFASEDTSWLGRHLIPRWIPNSLDKANRTSKVGWPSAQTLSGWPPGKPNETAWLDGLRGIAAFLVFTYHLHLTLFYGPALEAPFGARILSKDETSKSHDSNPERLWDLWRLPFLRLWMCSGHVQVSIFFVLSGFVLSWSPLEKIRQGRNEKVLAGLSSAILRRWVRLYLPCFAIATWHLFALYVGLPDGASEKRAQGFWAQLWDFLLACEKFANPFLINRNQFNAVHEYDWTMWTIPFEFSGSLLVFGLCLATARSRRYWRRSFVIALVAVYACLKAEWTFWLFASGMLIANYTRHRGGFEQLTVSSDWKSKVAWSSGMLISLLLAGVPNPSDGYNRPGYEWLEYLTSAKWMKVEGGARIWFSWSGILFIVSASHLKAVRGFFEMRPARYLGRVSYMLYLTHRTVLTLVGEPLKRVLLAAAGRKLFINDGDGRDAFAHGAITLLLYLVILIVIVPLVVLVAHACEVLIDRPSTKLARKIDDWFTVDVKLETGEAGDTLLPIHTKDDGALEDEMVPLTADMELPELDDPLKA